MPTIQEITAEIVEIPLRRSFVTAQDKLARQVSRPVVITITLANGHTAVGEAVPVAYVTGETPESVLIAVESAKTHLIGGDARRLKPLTNRLQEVLPDSPTARAGIEMALYAAFSELNGVSLWRLWGGSVDSVVTDTTLSIAADAADCARESAARGFRHFKMKVGGENREEDFARMVAVHEAVPGAFIRLDANQGFEPEEALDFIRRALRVGVRLELVEQPVLKEDLRALNLVAGASPVPIFADETVKSPADALRLVHETRVHGINIKLMKAGITGALDIIAIARAAGRRLMLGCMLETRRGIGHSLALACGTGAFEFLDLDSHMLLMEEGENVCFSQKGPRLMVTHV